jgi:hypothetical protein
MSVNDSPLNTKRSTSNNESESEYKSSLNEEGSNSEDLETNNRFMSHTPPPYMPGANIDKFSSTIKLDYFQKPNFDKKPVKLHFDNVNGDKIEEISSDVNTYRNLKNKDFKNIYDSLTRSELLVFVNDIILENSVSRCLFKKIELPQKYDVNMLSNKYISKFKKQIELWNKEISDKLKNNKSNNVLKIVFNDDEILTNVLYKKMIIYNSILFIPLKDYGLKKIEYKIRGFCQLMEELGASTIEIEFVKKNVKNNLIRANNKVKSKQLGDVVGNLGFHLKNNSNNENKQKYELNYSNNTSIILNQSLIEKKIRNGYYIITKWNYSSNLELQYIVASRCQHFIKSYSTNFNLYENFILDKKLETSLKAYGINYGLEIEKQLEEINQTVIKTNVIFMADEFCFENITGYNVNLDANGYIFLMKSIQEQDFEKVGIYKIYEFLNSYIDERLKNTKDYNNIKKNLLLLQEEFSINELIKLFLNYFDKNSRWLHIINIINILAMKTRTFDKLGYFLLSKNSLNNNNTYSYLLEIIKNLVDKESFNNYFINFESLNLYYFNMLINELKLNIFNLSKLEFMINKINSFNKKCDNFKDIMDKFNNHNKTYFYLEHIIPYIIKKYNSDEGITLNHLIYYQINCDEKLDLFYQDRKKRNDFLRENIPKLYNNDLSDNYISLMNKIKKYTLLDNLDEIKSKYSENELIDILINYDINLDFKRIIPDIYGYKLLRKQIKYGNSENINKNIIDFYTHLLNIMIKFNDKKIGNRNNIDKVILDKDNLINSNYYEIYELIKGMLQI